MSYDIINLHYRSIELFHSITLENVYYIMIDIIDYYHDLKSHLAWYGQARQKILILPVTLYTFIAKLVN